MIDLNSKTMLSDRINFLIDDRIVADRRFNDKTLVKRRNYLGGSVVGHPCDRNVQYMWLSVLGEVPRPEFSPRIIRIFDRGDIYEKKARYWLEGAGISFSLNPPDISDFDGKFGGHVDGIIVGFFPGASPTMLPSLWECKCLGSKGWKTLAKDGLHKYSPTYFGQVQIYMHYLNLKSCLFTAVNADTMELQHIAVDYDGVEAASVLAKIARVFDATYLGELLPRITADPAFYLCSYCPFRGPCWK